MRDAVRVVTLVFAVLLCGIADGRVSAREHETAPHEAPGKVALPPKVAAAFRKAYPKATIQGVSKEGADYEIESVDAGQRRDLVYRADGTLVSYEEVIAERQVPAAVVSAVKARFPDVTMTTFEKVVTGERISYEVAGTRAGKPVELELTAAGAWLAPKAK